MCCYASFLFERYVFLYISNIFIFFPTSCLRNKMVQWFRLVLQWNPHKRGRITDESGTSHLVVFTMLQHALSNKVCMCRSLIHFILVFSLLICIFCIQIVYIFCVPFYKINTYEIDNATTIRDLQLLIEKDTNIEVKHQTLTNYNGVMLTESTASVISQIKVCIFVIYI